MLLDYISSFNVTFLNLKIFESSKIQKLQFFTQSKKKFFLIKNFFIYIFFLSVYQNLENLSDLIVVFNFNEYQNQVKNCSLPNRNYLQFFKFCIHF